MESISVNKFRDNLKTFVDSAADRHEPLRVTRRNGKDFVIMSIDDWESEQETLYVLQNPILMKQIRDYQDNRSQDSGYRPSQEELDEIISEGSE